MLTGDDLALGGDIVKSITPSIRSDVLPGTSSLLIVIIDRCCPTTIHHAVLAIHHRTGRNRAAPTGQIAQSAFTQVIDIALLLDVACARRLLLAGWVDRLPAELLTCL